MNSKRRLSLTSSAHKLKLDSVNKIIKLDKSKKQKKDAINKQFSRIALAELIRNTPNPNQPPDFKLFLSNETNVRIFKEFLQTQYCQENLNFYLACERYRNLDTEGVGQELAKFIATQIYNDHLSENARQPVNVNNACIKIIKDNLKNPKSNLLCDAQAEIFELMRTDCYPRFCKTWQLDRETAQKILYQTQQAGPDQPDCMVSFSSETKANLTQSSSESLTIPPRRSSLRLNVKPKDTSLSSNSTECPRECPYFRMGRLPCQWHTCSKKRKAHQAPLTNHRVDLRRIHQPPTIALENGLPSQLLSSPPPPLPPKPDNIDLDMISNKKYRPYVGRVFNV